MSSAKNKYASITNRKDVSRTKFTGDLKDLSTIGDKQVQHIFPVNMFTGKDGKILKDLLDELGEHNQKSIDINDPKYLIPQPANRESQSKWKEKRYHAAVHSGPHPDYTKNMRATLEKLASEFNTEKERINNSNLDPAVKREKLRTLSKIVFQDFEGVSENVKKFSINKDIDKVKIFTNNSEDRILWKNFLEEYNKDRPDNQKINPKKYLTYNDFEKNKPRHNGISIKEIEKQLSTFQERRNFDTFKKIKVFSNLSSYKRNLDVTDDDQKKKKLDSDTKRKLKKVFNSKNTSGTFGALAMGVAGYAAIKILKDKYRGITTEQAIDIITKSGLGITKEMLANMAKEKALEAIPSLAAKLVPGFGWILTAYEIYENYSALRNAAQLLEQAHPGSEHLKKFNNFFDTLENMLPSWFGEDEESIFTDRQLKGLGIQDLVGQKFNLSEEQLTILNRLQEIEDNKPYQYRGSLDYANDTSYKHEQRKLLKEAFQSDPDLLKNVGFLEAAANITDTNRVYNYAKQAGVQLKQQTESRNLDKDYSANSRRLASNYNERISQNGMGYSLDPSVIENGERLSGSMGNEFLLGFSGDNNLPELQMWMPSNNVSSNRVSQLSNIIRSAPRVPFTPGNQSDIIKDQDSINKSNRVTPKQTIQITVNSAVGGGNSQNDLVAEYRMARRGLYNSCSNFD